MKNFKIVINILGLLLVIEGLSMLASTIFSLYFNDPDIRALLISSGITCGVGLITFLLTRKADKKIGRREGYVIVSIVWIVFSFFGALPFYLSGEIPSFTDAYFETISGFTTTGSSILNDIEGMSHGLLFWRSMTQWLGGMGIIVLSLAILPLFGIGGMQLFIAEVPGPTPDKLHPRVKETARRLWGIYVFFTLIETFLLMVGGMSFFDAINHSFTTMATGGYSTKQASIAHFDTPFIQYVIILFMLLAGTNFTISYFALKGKFKKIWRNEEFKVYLGIIGAFTLIITACIIYYQGTTGENAFRTALFQVVSIITTTGYVSSDYLQWARFLPIFIFLLMFIGGSAGSTGGGIKVVRVLLLFKNSYFELKRLIHPNAVIPVRLSGRAVSPEIVTNVLAFIVFYGIMMSIGILVMSIVGLDLDSAIGSVVTTLGNIGPGIGSVGPADNFAHIHPFGKWFLSFLMVLGRLELFTVLLLFSPAFWKK